ncbi:MULTISPECIES: DsrE/DsrF/DrsH-like family protein [unclassified Saccharibacter]|uniref:DsrE/DsrF/DrsH-like family protein n=1 Tax=unclassified Saccharibacter TaxID=2648722 RepID=UPI00132780F6|nr:MULTISPECIES: DsrE/DsrF/DrsH-like family protein [unclassified Saccharibacter]MXV35918.1 hypothetical protein [Saccharibacter sp. EH611]MXV58038.1 hypothetical protein [Saccharibacter sp. EH70]MXV66276.1 hypothetical protein [Saccharibacter sp. EH60]
MSVLMYDVGITLSDCSWERHHHAFTLACSFLALNRSVLIFAGGRSVLTLSEKMEGLDGALSDDLLKARQIPSLRELRDAIISLGGAFMACETGMKMAGLSSDDLMAGIRVRGMVSFLTEVGSHPIMTL